MEYPSADAIHPNDVWCVDFKGWWRTGDGTRCEPFMVSNAMSRYMLVCKPVKRTEFVHLWPVMTKALGDYASSLSARPIWIKEKVYLFRRKVRITPS